MRSVRSFGAGLLVVLAAASALIGCSGTTTEAPASSSSEQPVITGQPAGFDPDDITFAYDVITHHGQSAELAALVPDRSTDPDLVALAASVTAEQSPELELAKVLLVQWNENPNDAFGRSGAVAGMVDGPTIARLQSLTGQEFDTLWLESMIGHAQGAVSIAEAEVADGANVDAKAAAQKMIDSQQAQIGQMQQLLDAV